MLPEVTLFYPGQFLAVQNKFSPTSLRLGADTRGGIIFLIDQGSPTIRYDAERVLTLSVISVLSYFTRNFVACFLFSSEINSRVFI